MEPRTNGTARLEDQLALGRERFLAYVRRRVRDPELAEDILQDSLLRAVRAAPSLTDEDRLLAWFQTVLEHAVVDAYRRRGVERKRVVQDALEKAERPAEETAEEEAAVCECFRALVPTLKPEYAEMISALDLGGEPPAAVAGRLGITPTNLKVRRHRARQALRERLEQTCRTCATHHCLDCDCERS